MAATTRSGLTPLAVAGAAFLMSAACSPIPQHQDAAILGPYAVARIDDMFRMDFYNLDVLLWTQIFYNLIHRYDHATEASERKKVINTLKPLYFARSLSFNYQTWKYNIRYAEAEIREQALGFATQRYYLWGLYHAHAEKGKK